MNYPLGRRERSTEPDGGGGGGRRRYLEVLMDQVQSKMAGQMEKRKLDDDHMQSHFQHFDGYWGRPGFGAPWQGKGPQKENLMKILHYPTTKVNENLLCVCVICEILTPRVASRTKILHHRSKCV